LGEQILLGTLAKAHDKDITRIHNEAKPFSVNGLVAHFCDLIKQQ